VAQATGVSISFLFEVLVKLWKRRLFFGQASVSDIAIISQK
jgi:hypothetical protein